MALSNAERQRLYIARLKEKAAIRDKATKLYRQAVSNGHNNEVVSNTRTAMIAQLKEMPPNEAYLFLCDMLADIGLDWVILPDCSVDVTWDRGKMTVQPGACSVNVTNTPRVLNKRTDTIPPDAVYCGRRTRHDKQSKYANPFKMRIEADRDAVCDRFEAEILPTLDVSELRGKDLVCWCAPKRCHCDAILAKANGN